MILQSCFCHLLFPNFSQILVRVFFFEQLLQPRCSGDAWDAAQLMFETWDGQVRLRATRCGDNVDKCLPVLRNVTSSVERVAKYLTLGGDFPVCDGTCNHHTNNQSAI